MPRLDTDKSPLIAEFLKDHQQFSRLLYQIKKLLDENNFEAAQERAAELDRLAGPHIAFEEAELYPRLKILGERNVTEDLLVDQHRDAVDVLRMLIEVKNPNPETIEQIKSGFERALAHAEHCGSLISLMTQLDENEQAESLRELIRLRKTEQLWTDLDQNAN